MTTPIKISLDFAKKLCPDFQLVYRKDLDKKACAHLMKDGEMCNDGKHFVCELVLYKQRSAAKNERDKREAISASRVNLIDTCSRKYHLLREKYLKSPAGEPTFLKVGNAFGTARARIDQGLPFHPDQVRTDIPQVDRAKVRAALRFYIANPPYPVGSVTCEDVCQFEFEGTWYMGYSDAVSKNGGTVVEWKYAQGTYNHLKLARQAAIYLHGFPSATRFVCFRMKKSAHRPKKIKKKGETMQELEDRIFESLVKDGPEKVIATTTIGRDQIDVEGVLRQMRGTFEQVLPALRQAGMPPNYSSCDLCDFQMVCGEKVGCSTNEIVRLLTLRKGTA